jgi:hypothetical protein
MRINSANSALPDWLVGEGTGTSQIFFCFIASSCAPLLWSNPVIGVEELWKKDVGHLEALSCLRN